MKRKFDFYNKQYEELRSEILFHLRELTRTPIYAVVAAAALWAWLATNQIPAQFRWCWFIAVAFPVLGALRSRATGRKIQLIGAYIRQFEKKVTHISIPGWETSIQTMLDSRNSASSGKHRNRAEWWSHANPHWYSGLDRTGWVLWSFFVVIAIAVGFWELFRTSTKSH